LVVLVIKPRALLILGKYATTELHPQTIFVFLR
jgi:hypothetical protein